MMTDIVYASWSNGFYAFSACLETGFLCFMYKLGFKFPSVLRSQFMYLQLTIISCFFHFVLFLNMKKKCEQSQLAIAVAFIKTDHTCLYWKHVETSQCYTLLWKFGLLEHRKQRFCLIFKILVLEKNNLVGLFSVPFLARSEEVSSLRF